MPSRRKLVKIVMGVVIIAAAYNVITRMVMSVMFPH